MSVRSTNTYEERTIGVFTQSPEAQDNQGPYKYLGNHMRNQLGFDLWYIFLGTFIICAVEAVPISDPSNLAFNVFAIFFEATSAYGNVGLSLGTNNSMTSLSGDFHSASTLVICALMIRGRHRGLPVEVDRAVMLPEPDGPDETSMVELRSLPELESLKRAKTM